MSKTTFITPEKGKRFDTREDAKSLVQLLEKNKDAAVVNLSGNTISIEASEEIAAALREFVDLEELNCSDFFTTRLKTDVPISIHNLVNAIKDHPKLSLVDFSDNALGEPGVRSISQLLFEKESFTTLVVTNGGLGPKGALTLTQQIRSNLGIPLLSESQIPSEEAASLKVEPAEHVEHDKKELSLKRLLVGRNRFKEPGAYILSKGIEYLPNLIQLEVNGNSITPTGIEAILHSLQYCPNVQILNFYDNTFKEKGVAALLQLLPKLPNLKSLNLEDCTLEKGIKNVIESLGAHNHELEYLNLSYNEIDHVIGDVLIDVIKTKKNLKKLDLNGNALSKKQIALIKRITQSMGAEIGSLSDNEDEEEDNEGGSDEEEDEDDENVNEIAKGVSSLSL